MVAPSVEHQLHAGTGYSNAFQSPELIMTRTKRSCKTVSADLRCLSNSPATFILHRLLWMLTQPFQSLRLTSPAKPDPTSLS